MERIRRLLGTMLVLGLVLGISNYGLASEEGLAISASPVDEENIPVYKGYYVGEIMPTPKEVEYKDNYIPIIDLRKKKAKACIVIGEEAAIPEKTSALEIRSRIKYLSGEEINILKDADNYLDYDVVIAIGKPTTNKLINRYCNKYKVRIPEKKEGYIIKVVKDEGRRIVLCVGNDDTGVYFSAQSLNQLFTKRRRQLCLREVSVIDWPSFPIRNWRSGPRSQTTRDFHEWAGMFKLNSYWVSGGLSEGTWRAPSAKRRKIVKDICLYASKRGLDTTQYDNPYIHEDRPAGMPWPIPVSKILSFKQKPIKISDTAEIESLINLYRISLDNGGRTIVILFDDLLPVDEDGRYVLPYQEDREKFGSLGNAHAYLVNEVHKRLKKDYPDYQMIVCPVYYWLPTNWFNQEKEANQYLKELGEKVPPDVMMFWTGPLMRSHVITREDVLRYSRLIKRKPFLWDNTIYDYHSPCEYLFDSYKPEYPQDFAKLSSGIHNNGGISEIYKIGLINFMDYAWNPDAYDSETSLRKALAIVGGEDMVDTLISFRDNYYRMKEKPTDNLVQFKKEFRELKRDFERIEAKIKDKTLVQTLKRKYEGCYWFGVKQLITTSTIDNGYLYPVSPNWEKDLAFCEKIARKYGFKDVDKKIKGIKDFLKELLELKRYKIITLENEYIKVDIIPGLGGKIHRMVDKRKGINYLYTPRIMGYPSYWGGYREYATHGSAVGSPGWNEQYDYQILVDKGEKKVTLSCLLSNEYLLTREISIRAGTTEIEIRSELTNTSSQTRKSTLRFLCAFTTDNIKDNILYASMGDNKVRKYPVLQTLSGEDLPKGFWLIANEKENTGILNSFSEDEVETCYIWSGGGNNIYHMGLFSKYKELKPGESLSINHKYVLLDDVSESLKKYEIE